MELHFATLLVYLSGYGFLCFLALCLAAGLYYIAELVEEHTRLTRRILLYAIRVVLAVHVILLVWDRLPVLCCLAGAGAHLVYLRLLKRFPYISLTSPDFWAAVGALVLSHCLWLHHFFSADPHTRHGLEHVLAFMLITTWAVPGLFFISLAANESVLPGGAGGLPASPGVGGASAGGGKGGAKRSLFLVVLGALRAKARLITSHGHD